MELRGKYVKLINRNSKGVSRFTVTNRINDPHKNRYGEFVCEGIIPDFIKNTPLVLIGEWDSDYIFKADKIRIYSDDYYDITDFLTGICPGVGEQTITKITKQIGGEIFNLPFEEGSAEKLAESISRLSLKKAENLLNAIKQKMDIGNKFSNIACIAKKYDISSDSAYLLVSQCDDETELETRLNEHPYRTGMMAGIEFLDIDKIAYYYEHNPLSNERIESLCLYVLRLLSKQGHTCITFDELYEDVNKLSLNSLFGCDLPKLLVYTVIFKSNELILSKEKQECVALKDYDECENIIAHELFRLQDNYQKNNIDEDYIMDIEAELGFSLEKMQRLALHSLESPGVKIITGGPGTGKSTDIKAIIKMFRHMHPNASYVLCAPTGRAAQRMSELTGESAQTVHSLIEYCSCNNEDIHTRGERNPIDAELIIVDEVSMLDAIIFSLFLPTIKKGTIVLLCGDVDQLPSVEAGNVLHDLIASEVFEVYRLNVCKRQTGKNIIVDNAIKVNSGNTDLVTSKNFDIIRVDSAKELARKTVEICESTFNYANKFSQQVVSTTKKYEAGTSSLNAALQQKLNNNETEEKFMFDGVSYRLHDKVIMIHNQKILDDDNTELSFYNGDIGEIIQITDTSFTVACADKVLTLDKIFARYMTHAYCITVHKSQGSEYDDTIIALPRNPGVLLKRKLLYTAITRAKEKVRIISEGDALERAILNNTEDIRITALVEKIKKIFKTGIL